MRQQARARYRRAIGSGLSQRGDRGSNPVSSRAESATNHRQGQHHIFAEKCAPCHGPEGKGGVTGVTAAPLPPLIGGDPITDISAAMKRIANFWPYSATLFDYTRRAMPWQQPMTLGNDEVYALTAYILALNKLIGENDTMNAQTLPKVKMPNRDGFIVRFPDAM